MVRETDRISRRQMCLALWGECLAELDDFVQRIAKLFEARQGDDDSVVATINLLDDSQELTPRIFSQVEREMLALNPNAVILQLRVHS